MSKTTEQITRLGNHGCPGNKLWYSRTEVDELLLEQLRQDRKKDYGIRLELRKDLNEEIFLKVPSNVHADMIALQVVDEVFAKYQVLPSTNISQISISQSSEMCSSGDSTTNSSLVSKCELSQDYIPLKDADISLVDFSRKTPYCKLHGAMLNFTLDGIWRCVHPVLRNGKHIENDCKAGCQLSQSSSEVTPQNQRVTQDKTLQSSEDNVVDETTVRSNGLGIPLVQFKAVGDSQTKSSQDTCKDSSAKGSSHDSLQDYSFDHIGDSATTEQIVQSEGYCCSCSDRGELICNKNTRDDEWLKKQKVRDAINNMDFMCEPGYFTLSHSMTKEKLLKDLGL